MKKKQNGKSKFRLFILFAIFLSVAILGIYQLWSVYSERSYEQRIALEEIEEIESSFFKDGKEYSSSFTNEQDEISNARDIIDKLSISKKKEWTKKIDDYSKAVNVANKMTKPTLGIQSLNNIDEAYNKAKNSYEDADKTTQNILKNQYSRIKKAYEFAKGKEVDLLYMNYRDLYSKSSEDLKK